MEEMGDRPGSLTIAAVGDVAMLAPPGPALWREVWDGADVRLANLEGVVLAEHHSAADKLVRIRLPEEEGRWLADLGVTAVSLANNHMLDWGSQSVDHTRRLLAASRVGAAGAGADRDEAEAPLVFEGRGLRVAFLSWACTVPPGFAAAPDHPGIAALRIRSWYAVESGLQEEQPGTPPNVRTEPIEDDLRRLEARLAQARAEADVVLLSIHWGVPPQWRAPFQPAVAEYQIAIAERAARAGADAILGHHPHAPEGMGVVTVREADTQAARSVPVLYSLGNFIFHPEYSQGGLEVEGGPDGELPPLTASNHETCVAVLDVRTAGGRSRVVGVRLETGVLDARGEAMRPDPATRTRVARRLEQGSRALGADVSVVDGCVVWQSPDAAWGVQRGGQSA